MEIRIRALVRAGALVLAALPLLACGVASTPASASAAATPATGAATANPVAAVVPDPAPTPALVPAAAPAIATPTPEPAPPAPPPQYLAVGFGGLVPGSYPVHLHRICNGRQGFHIAYLPDLQVSAAGSGSIAVPAADFGRGWCVVVYANRAATAVAAYRPI